MTLSFRRLAPGDEAILALLAREEVDFGLDRGGVSARPLEPAAARRYLEHPAVLLWVAFDAEVVVGLLQCTILPLRAGEESELLLYDIGVRGSRRRQGIGRALLAEMERWMGENGVADVWVLADGPGALEFYRACGFTTEEPVPVYLLRHLPTTITR